jgi:hypothetical protein
MRAALALIAPLAAALVAGGCGHGGSKTAAELALEREDLVFVAHALQALEGQSGAEVSATKDAWPQIANGLAARSRGLYTHELIEAREAARRLRLPPLMDERQAAALTGPAAGIAGLYREFAGLAGTGWRMLGASVYQIEHGSPAAARFARANSPLYIDSIYDAHFGLAQISKQLQKGYAKLGGEEKFGSALTQAEVDGLTRTYDEPHDELEPHVGVRLGV